MEREKKILKRWIIFFMIALVLSGLTTIPIEDEVWLLLKKFEENSTVSGWLQKVYDGVHNSNQQYPFLFYGLDWLAFAHFILAILFIGPLKDPVKNKWVIEFGIIASVLVIPLALIAGYFRGIPFWWRLIDCSFGVFGTLVLWVCLRKIKILEKLSDQTL